LFAIDPFGLGGLLLRAAHGPARERFVADLGALLPQAAPRRRAPAQIDDERLLGGLDLAATLRAGKPVRQRGLLDEAAGGLVILPMAERMADSLAGRLAQRLDAGGAGPAGSEARFGVLALDEGDGEDEAAPLILAERLAFHVSLDGVSHRDAASFAGAAEDVEAARALRETAGPLPDAVAAALSEAALACGVSGMAAPILAARAAQAAAAADGRATVNDADVALAARLVLGPRARFAPAPPDAEPPPPDAEPPPAEPPDEPASDDAGERELDDADLAELAELAELAVAAAAANLPPGLIKDADVAGRAAAAASARRGGGAQRKSAKRGRPAGVRAGALSDDARLDLVATLTAAAPRQRLRRSADGANGGGRIRVHPDDFRIRKFSDRRELTIVFCVDASGSTALQRLGEAKGAVELLLAEAYVTRTHAALIVFRGEGAETLLAPTRSLARAKAQLEDLPGGGGTPLAAGLEATHLLALSERRRGRDVLAVILTDGRANVALGGGGREAAMQDALNAAQAMAADAVDAVVIDTSPRRRSEGPDLAAAMAARYVALPFVEAGAVQDAVNEAARAAAR